MGQRITRRIGHAITRPQVSDIRIAAHLDPACHIGGHRGRARPKETRLNRHHIADRRVACVGDDIGIAYHITRRCPVITAKVDRARFHRRQTRLQVEWRYRRVIRRVRAGIRPIRQPVVIIRCIHHRRTTRRARIRHHRVRHTTRIQNGLRNHRARRIRPGFTHAQAQIAIRITRHIIRPRSQQARSAIGIPEIIGQVRFRQRDIARIARGDRVDNHLPRHRRA